MKKNGALIIILLLAVLASSCGAGNNPSATTVAATTVSATTVATTTTTAATTVATTAATAAVADTAASATDASAQPVELVVFAAASMKETLTRIAELYKTVAPNVSLVYNFDSSGTLKTQIQEGAECDIFISAGKKQVDELDASADASINKEGLDFILQGTRFSFLENRVTLCVPDGNPANIASFDDLAKKLQSEDILMAMGNSDVPVGQYTQKILAYFKLDEESLAAGGKITYGSNVKEVTTQISEASVSCGVIYCTDAFSAGLEIVDYATAEMCGQVIYPAAVLNISEHADAAKAFLNYLKTPEAMAVFEKVGFAAAF